MAGRYSQGLNRGPLTLQQIELINQFTSHLVTGVTGALMDNKLLVTYRNILSSDYNTHENKDFKTMNYFAWTGSNLLKLPKILMLPMVIPPRDWEVVAETGAAHSGGYLLSSFTNVSYQGYLNTQTTRIHNHFLHLKQCDSINVLQKVPFEINTEMIKFFSRFEEELTENEIVLLTDKWIHPSKALTIEVNTKWARTFFKREAVRESVDHEFTSKKNATMRNQDIIKIVKFYAYKKIYWPAVQDFRKKKIYRLGAVNIQLNPFIRSLIAFHSDQPLIKRRKQSKKIFDHYNLLIKTKIEVYLYL
jgi:hypothetical protein